MTETTGARLLVDCLLAQGVTTAFGVPGESYLAVLDALHDVPIRMVPNRQEGGAGFMAAAWGKLTGAPGIAFVTRGPGATNAAIGVHTARQDSAPMILFVGQVATEMREREAFQEVDYRAVFGPLAKWATEIESADRVPEIVARAFAVAQTGRPGPVVVALPEDVLAAATVASARAARAGSARCAGAGGRVRDRPPARRGPGAADPRRRRRLGRSRARRPARLRRGEPAAGARGLPLPGPARQREPELRRRRGPRKDPRGPGADAGRRRDPRRRGALRRDPDRRLRAVPGAADGGDADPRPCLGRRTQPHLHRRSAGPRPPRSPDAGAGRPRARRQRLGRADRGGAFGLGGGPRHPAAAGRARHGRGGAPSPGGVARRRDPDQRRGQFLDLDQPALPLHRAATPARAAVGRDGLRRSGGDRGQGRLPLPAPWWRWPATAISR